MRISSSTVRINSSPPRSWETSSSPPELAVRISSSPTGLGYVEFVLSGSRECRVCARSTDPGAVAFGREAAKRPAPGSVVGGQSPTFPGPLRRKTPHTPSRWGESRDSNGLLRRRDSQVPGIVGVELLILTGELEILRRTSMRSCLET